MSPIPAKITNREWCTGKNFIGFNFTRIDGSSLWPPTAAHTTEPVILGDIIHDYSHGTRLKRFASHDVSFLPYFDYMSLNMLLDDGYGLYLAQGYGV
jgi:hypothetical protein